MLKNLFRLVLGLGLVWGVISVYQTVTSPPKLTVVSAPTPNISSGAGVNTPMPPVIASQIAAQKAADVPTIPPPLVSKLYDESAMRMAAAGLKTTHPDDVRNIQSSDFMGVGYAMQVEHLGNQGWTLPNGDKWGEATLPFTMTFNAMVSTTIGVGVAEDLFWNSATYSVTDVTTKSMTLSTGQLVLTESAKLSASYTVVLCVTKVEIPGESAIMIERPHLQPPLPEASVWVETLAENQGRAFHPEVLSLRALQEARQDGTSETKVSWAYGQAQLATAPGGWWTTKFTTNVLEPIVKAAGFDAAIVNFTVDAGQHIRCDGKPIQ